MDRLIHTALSTLRISSQGDTVHANNLAQASVPGFLKAVINSAAVRLQFVSLVMPFLRIAVKFGIRKFPPMSRSMATVISLFNVKTEFQNCRGAATCA